MLNICCKLVNFKIIFIFEFKKYKFINNYYFILFKLKNVLGKLSFTLDCWTSTNNVAFLGIICHFVDVDWCLKETLVDFIHLSGSHSGENLAKEFLKSIDEDFNILTKVINFLFYLFIFFFLDKNFDI